jgi:hypothetical protein
MYMSSCSLFLDFLFSRATTSMGRMMMMIVVLRVRVSHLKHKWQHSSTLSCRYNTIQRCLLQNSPHPSIHPSLLAHLLFPYLFFTSPYPSGCCCSWVMSIIVVHIRRRNTYIVHRARAQKEREDAQ